jgi:uncharacterized peroxidase-related enzyme
MIQFILPEANDLSSETQGIFKELQTQYGSVPNIFSAFASSENGLSAYFNFIRRKNSLTPRENEVVNIVVSQVNQCQYCLSFHTALAKRLNFSDDEINVLRSADISSDHRLDALAKLTKEIVERKGSITGVTIEQFYEAGFDQGHLVDVVLAVGNVTTMNLLYAITEVPIDWPVVKL